MERLTYFKDGYWRVNFSGVQYQADFVDRLAAYEDSRLSPEDAANLHAIVRLGDGMTLMRLRELAVADQEGHVIVLPCKVGQRVFSLLDKDKHISECEVKQIGLGNETGFVVLEPIGARGRKYGVALNGFGKTVFLTREKAKKALAEMEGKKNV